MLLTHSAARPVAAQIPERFANARIVDYERGVARQITDALRDERGIIFVGAVGRGKTHAMAAVANELGSAGFVTWIEFLETIRAWWRLKTEDAHRFDPARWAERERLLFVDDVGTEASRSSIELGQDVFPQVMNARYKAGLRTFLTTNLSVAELSARYGDRTVSRMAETSVWIEMVGDDRRLR